MELLVRANTNGDMADCRLYGKMMSDLFDEHIEDIIEGLPSPMALRYATENQIKSLWIAGFDMKRFVLGGYYTNDDDFLKRPLSILKNDLWEQLNKTCGDTMI